MSDHDDAPAPKRQKTGHADVQTTATKTTTTTSLPCLPQICTFCNAKTLLALRRTAKCWKQAVNREVDARQQQLMKNNLLLPQEFASTSGRQTLAIQKEWSKDYGSNKELMARATVQFASTVFRAMHVEVLPEILERTGSRDDFERALCNSNEAGGAFMGGSYRIQMSSTDNNNAVPLQQKYKSWGSFARPCRGISFERMEGGLDLLILFMPSSSQWKWTIETLEMRCECTEYMGGRQVRGLRRIMRLKRSSPNVVGDGSGDKADEDPTPTRFQISGTCMDSTRVAAVSDFPASIGFSKLFGR